MWRVKDGSRSNVQNDRSVRGVSGKYIYLTTKEVHVLKIIEKIITVSIRFETLFNKVSQLRF